MADIKVYGTLVNATQSGKIAYAEQVFDTEQNKTQAQINAVVGSSGKSRIKVVSWNLGNFSLGTSGDPTITPQTYDEMKAQTSPCPNHGLSIIRNLCKRTGITR